MEIIKAATARAMTIESIKAKRARMLEMINTRIMTNISMGNFECSFRIDSPALQDDLFDYLTACNYAVHFSQTDKNKERYGSDSRIMTVSWEDAIQ